MVAGFIHGGEGPALRYLPESLADPPRFDRTEERRLLDTPEG